MKIFTSISLVLAVSALPLTAQETDEQSASATVGAVVKLKQSPKPARINILSSAGKNAFSYESPEGPKNEQLKNCDSFLMITPKDLVSALSDYNGNHLSAARSKFDKVKTKYAAMIGLPNNAAARAANLELDCAIRMLDWPAVKNLSEHFRGKGDLGAGMTNRLEVAKLLGLLSADDFSDGIIERAASLLEEKNKLSLEELGWLNYALGRAYEAKIPTAELEAGELTEPSLAAAGQAVDAYCTAMVATYGGKVELPIDASARAAEILSSMPGVKAALAKIGQRRDSLSLRSLPAAMKEAAALAYVHLHFLNPNSKNEKLAVFASYHVGRKVTPQQSGDANENARQPGLDKRQSTQQQSAQQAAKSK
ncbi:MAG: hypothetical protein LUG84_00800 [Akkermansiaceae bacterium]|nr:hypothetical protein [Akkermansiaceae bacterium]